MGAGHAGGRDWTDDEIYGRAPAPGGEGAASDVPPDMPGRPYEPPAPGQQAEGFDYPSEFPGDGFDNEEVMQDPWANQGSDGGLFGGGDGGGGGGSWGDWGDWS